MKGKKLTLFGVGAVALAKFLSGGADAKADNSGMVRIWNTSDSTEGYVDGVHWPGYSEEPNDSGDLSKEFGLNNLPNGSFEAYFDVNGTRLWDDYRPVDSNIPFRLKLVYKGRITQGNEPNNWLEVEFPWGEGYEFGDRSMILQQEDANGVNDSNGLRCDVRAVRDNRGRIDLGKLPAKNYKPDKPYLHLRLDFDKLLADLDGRGIVNLKDYAILAKYWMHEGRCIADISGPDGVPDMIVDTYDLAKMAEQWLYRIEDGELVAKIEKAIRPVLIAGQYRRSGIPEELFHGKEKAAELAQERARNRRVQLAKNYTRDLDLTLLEPKQNSNLKQMLALSTNNHNRDLSRNYETIDHKLQHNNPRVLAATQNGKKFYRV